MVGGEQATPFPRVPSPPPSTHPPPGFSSTPPPASSPIHIPARGVVHPGDTIFDLSGMDTVRLVDRETHTEPEMNSTADETTPLLNTISSLSSSIAGMRSSKPMPVPTLDNRLNPYGNAQVRFLMSKLLLSIIKCFITVMNLLLNSAPLYEK